MSKPKFGLERQLGPSAEQNVREILSQIPDIHDRVYLLVLMRGSPLQLAELADEILAPIQETLKGHHDK